MNDPPLDENVRVRMQGIRCEIDQDLEDVSASAHRMVDWVLGITNDAAPRPLSAFDGAPDDAARRR